MNGPSLAASALGLLTLLSSGLAWACPVCAQRTDGGVMRYLSLGAVVLMPWAVALTAGWYIRRKVTE